MLILPDCNYEPLILSTREVDRLTCVCARFLEKSEHSEAEQQMGGASFGCENV